MTTYAIQAHQLTKRFGDFTAVDNVSFEIRRGEIFGFLGPNGAGKTTTIRMILGLLRPTAGKVEILGMDAHRETARIRPRVGYMSQRFSLYNDLTVLQNLRFYGAAYGIPADRLEARIQEALALADLQGREEVKTGDLSGGWRQRLALGAAILHHPEIVFLDEPTAGVDPISRRAFWDLLYRLTDEGVTVFVTTHYMDEAEHCHRLAFIQRGRLIALGTPAELKRNVLEGQVLEISPSDAAQTVRVLTAARERGDLPLKSVELYGALVHVIAPPNARLEKPIRNLLRKHGIRVAGIAAIEPSLEDVFIEAMR